MASADIGALLGRFSLRAWLGCLAFCALCLDELPDHEAAQLGRFVSALLLHRPCEDTDALRWAKVIVHWQEVTRSRGLDPERPAETRESSAELRVTMAALVEAGLPQTAAVLGSMGSEGLTALRTLLASERGEAFVEGMDMTLDRSWVRTAAGIIAGRPA